MLTLLALAASLAAHPAPRPPPAARRPVRTPAEEEVLHLEEAMVDATRTRDTATMARMMAPFYVLVTQSGVATRREVLDGTAARQADFSALTIEPNARVRVLGDVAVVVFGGRAAGSDGGTAFDNGYLASAVWVRARPGGPWQIVSAHHTALRALRQQASAHGGARMG